MFGFTPFSSGSPNLEGVALRQLDKLAVSGTALRNNVDEAERRTLARVGPFPCKTPDLLNLLPQEHLR